MKENLGPLTAQFLTDLGEFCRSKRGLSTDLAKYVNAPIQHVSNWFALAKAPTIEQLLGIHKWLETFRQGESIQEWLKQAAVLQKEAQESHDADARAFLEELRVFCVAEVGRATDLARRLNVGQDAVSRWINAKSALPSDARIAAMKRWMKQEIGRPKPKI